jgi:hypothetical protein
METAVIAAIVGAVGGVVSGVIAALVTLRTKGLDRLIEERKLWVTAYDTKLLEQRLLEYKKLWKLTEASSRRYVAQLDIPTAAALAKDLTSWYYADGGMILSEDARDKFFDARRTLEPRGQPGGGWHNDIVKAFSALRTALCEDMNSRRGPTLRNSEGKDIEEDIEQESQAIR